MEVEVVRRGGFGGLTLRGVASTSELSPAAAGKAEVALQELSFGRPPSPPRHPDGFQFEIIVRDRDVLRSVVLDEADLPEELRPVIEAAVSRGHLE